MHAQSEAARGAACCVGVNGRCVYASLPVNRETVGAADGSDLKVEPVNGGGEVIVGRDHVAFSIQMGRLWEPYT